MGWGVTSEFVVEAGGRAPTTENLALSDSTVTVYVNRTPAASAHIGARDLYWIETAIAYQSVWLEGQPDYLERMLTQRVSQDGLTVEYASTSDEGGKEYAQLLAPMAARALKNLSWKGSRTVRMHAERLRGGVIVDPAQERYDDYNDWRP